MVWILVAALAGIGVGFLGAGLRRRRRTAPSRAVHKLPLDAPVPVLEGSERGYAMVDAVLRGLPDPAVLLDREGSILLANGEMRKLNTSAQPGRYIGSAVRAPAVIDAVERVRTGQTAQAVEFSLPGAFERHFKAFVTSVEWTGLESGPQESPLLVVIYDLTSIKRLEQMRVDFVANASHELRTPLASMAGFIETLRGPARDDKEAREKFLKIMEEQAARMGRLIEDLLSLSRIELNEHVLPSKAVRLDLLLSDVVDALAPMAKDAGVELEIQRDFPARVAGDRDELIQVFQNLIDNALHYGAAGKRVVIDIRGAKVDRPGAVNLDMVSVSVRDFGPGIDREHIPRLTERFYRVDVRQSRRQGGTGLGLAIVKHIVMRHRGFLEIHSEKGQGSTFTVHLPHLTRTVEESQNDPVTTVSVPEPKPVATDFVVSDLS